MYRNQLKVARVAGIIKFWAICACLAFALALAIALLERAIVVPYHWDGVFPQVEYRIKFTSVDGVPVEGVELKVTNAAGTAFYGYPISDYFPSTPVRSDAHGEMIFHHVKFGTLEFGGRGLKILGHQLDFNQPRFICYFLLDGRVIWSCDFRSLAQFASEEGEVELPWNLETFCDNFVGVFGRNFDISDVKDRNRDGIVDDAEQAAWNMLVDATSELKVLRDSSRPPIKLCKFRVVRIHVVVP